MYMGLHSGLGYEYKVNEKVRIEGYGKYLFTWQEGKRIELVSKEKIKFEGVYSHRIRIGARGEYEVKGNIKPYVDVCYEQELEGKIKARANGYPIEDVSMSGGSGILEVGANMEIGKSLSVDLSGEGFVGKRQGLLGMLKLKYAI